MTLPEITEIVIQATALVTSIGGLVAAIGAMKAANRAETRVMEHEVASADRASWLAQGMPNPVPGSPPTMELDPDLDDGHLISRASKREIERGG